MTASTIHIHFPADRFKRVNLVTGQTVPTATFFRRSATTTAAPAVTAAAAAAGTAATAAADTDATDAAVTDAPAAASTACSLIA